MEKDTAKPLVIVAFLAFAVYRIIDRRNQAGRPPMVKYTIPWLGSAIEYGKDPDGLFERATYVSTSALDDSRTTKKTSYFLYSRTELGPIFRILAAGREIIYVTGPELISTVYRDPKVCMYERTPKKMNSDAINLSRHLSFCQ